MINPIWKDYFVNLGSASSVDFRILLHDTNEVIYTGRSYKRPGDTNNNIRINDICADYLVNEIPHLSQAEFTRLSLPLQFDIQVYITTAPGESPDWEDCDSVQFVNDWSYIDRNYSTQGLSDPINGRIAPNQWLIHTAINVSSETATLTFGNGDEQNVIIPVSRSNDFNDDFNFDFSRSTASAGSGSSVFDLSQWNDVVKVEIGVTTYHVVNICARFVLHYINAFGGWDSLLIEGNTIESDNITRSNRQVNYDNRSKMNRGSNNYVNEIEKTFIFHTGLMNDNESTRMFHLINSTDVYLEDLETGNILPVVLTNSTCEYKTFKNQGGRFAEYEINATIAHNMIRK